MTVCRACGFHNEPGASFCGSCGAYLEWTGEGPRPGAGTDATAPTPAPPAPPAGATPPPPVATGTVHLEPSTVTVEPGGETTIRIDAHNRSGIVDQFSAELTGVPPAWVDVQPPVLSLFPDDRGSFVVTIRPPRASTPAAGAMAFRAIVRSAADPSVLAAADGVLELGGFTQLSIEATPHTSRGKLAGKHRLTVRNDGNVPVAAVLTGTDPENGLAYRFRPDVVRAEPGTRGGVELRAKPRKKIWLGSVKWHNFQVTAAADGAEPVAVDAVMEQNKILPGWLPRAVIAVLVLGVGAGLLRSTVLKPKTAKVNAAEATTAPVAPTAPTTLAVTTAPTSAATGGGTNTSVALSTTTSTSTTTPTTLPKVVFTSSRSGQEQIWVMNDNGTSPKQLTTVGTSNTQPSLSPDRKQIAFVSNRDGNPEIYLMDADGGNQHPFTNDPKTDGFPRWSPDGKRIAFSSNRLPETTGFDIYTLNANGSGPLTNLTPGNPGTLDRKPTWSPDGTRIAFERVAGGTTQILIVPSGGGATSALTTGQSPAWSPDGTKIAFASTAAVPQIFVIPATSNPSTTVAPGSALTSSAGGNTDPWWSSDGGRIVFTSTRDGDEEIYIMPATGNPQTRLTNNGGPPTQNADRSPTI